MAKKILYICFIFYTLKSLSQDLHFSQFNENHALVNPALTGVTDPLRASLTYRDQWRSISTPYRSFGVSVESRLNNSSWQQVDKFRSMTFKERSVGRLAWGLSVYGDKAGTGNLNSTNAIFSLATFVPVSKKSFISLGLQGSFVQRRLENGNLIFPNQFNGYGYDANMPQNEKITATNYNYFGLAGGAIWSYGQQEKRIASNRQVKGNLGVSFYHITAPHNGFFSNKEALMMKYIVHGDLYFAPANFNTAILPSFILQRQGSSTEFMAGILLKYYLFNDSKYTGNVKRSSIGYGIYYRNQDAMIIALNFERQEQYAIGISYDVNLSRLVTATTSRGGLEISLRYTPPKAFLYQKKVVPQ